MLKKMLAAFVALALIFSPLGDTVFHQDTQVSAKGYRTGVKSFTPNKSNNFNTFFKNRNQRSNTNTATNGFPRGFSGGGFMRGMIFGGLSGLLFGSLLSHFGGFGMIAGFLINIVAILAIIALIRYLFVSFTERARRRRTEESDRWKR
jgi:predicted lipid-binding transport protein (Tim44 family)